MLKKYPGHKSVFLGVGDGGVYSTSTAIETILGSCVAVTLFCREKRIGGIFHALLPAFLDYEHDKLQVNRFRYVDSGIDTLFRRLINLGALVDKIEAKVFGGAEDLISGSLSVGRRNVATAFDVLSDKNIRVVASDVGGERGRKMIFLTSSGEVFVRYLRSREEQLALPELEPDVFASLPTKVKKHG
ncbi:chemotaxis protein CheD [Desulfovibrio inopinatus]|uniref:chemotaxis protein CheD n=1 Tax=Desulfovibrio inopinatus TaxID=102109 RepID=UPI000424B641|nr:chemotaxis protein CheD [Desulfovibrio inopinatus]